MGGKIADKFEEDYCKFREEIKSLSAVEKIKDVCFALYLTKLFNRYTLDIPLYPAYIY